MRQLGVLEALNEFRSVREQLEPGPFIMALLASLAASYAAAGFYRFFYERRGTGSQVHRAFPLLGIAITTLFIGVQLSIPLSLGLLGSLSIIRFRTPIKEPEEVGFIMLVIAASISAATFNFRFLAILYLVAFLSLVLTRAARGWTFLKRDGLLVLTVPAAAVETRMAAIETALAGQVRRFRVENSSIRDGAATYQYAFSGLKGGVAELQANLAKAGGAETLNVFLDRPGGLR